MAELKSMYQGDYEIDRFKRRYRDVPKGIAYTPNELSEAYANWVKSELPKRQMTNEEFNSFNEVRKQFWDRYCDIRDCVPLGTNQAFRFKQASLKEFK